MKSLVALLALAGVLLLSACNTMEGLGRDLEKAGEKVQSMTKK